MLLAPLDWGLGHTVRCIPIIRELLNQGCEVVVACNSKQRLLLVKDFPFLQFVHLRGYEIEYGKTRLLTLVKLILQVPKILTRINQEKAWLKDFLSKNRVDAIISDNRYGFSSRETHCIFITHQLRVRSGLGNFIDNLIQQRLYRRINEFSTCWIPDWNEANLSAAGELSHPRRLPYIPVKYIGCLSRFERCAQVNQRNDILVILSGPEPQRTIFEKIISKQLQVFQGSFVLVRGVFDNSRVPFLDDSKVFNHATGKELNDLVCASGVIICRSGYTSVMDVLKLAKKCILIPTPGQTEQEYLAAQLLKQNRARVASQEDFDLQKEFEQTKTLDFESLNVEMQQYKEVIAELAAVLIKSQNQSVLADLGNSKK